MAYQAVDFINEEEIWSLLEAGKRFGQEDIRQMIEKAREAKGLEPVEVAALIQVEDP